MKAYLRGFVNYEQNNWARLLLIAKFAYINANNSSTGYIFFELNCDYHSYVFYKKYLDFRFKSKVVDELTDKLKELIIAYQKYLRHAHELQKRVFNKSVKLRSYVSSNKIWLNSIYIKTK